MDHPNERSLHNMPIPRTGGIAILSGIIVGTALVVWSVNPSVAIPHWGLLGLLAIAVVSFLDDRHGVPAMRRFAVHALAAAAVMYGELAAYNVRDIFFGADFDRSIASVLLLLFTVWMTNLYNFMDGMDGFAAGMAVIGFGVFGVFGYLAGEPLFTAMNLIVVAAAVGFLMFNFPPARIFMGDTGSSALGFLAAIFSIWGAQNQVFPFWAALLVFSPFIVDASVTLVLRMARREKVWEAHRTHYYQRLVRLGWGHRRTVLAEYVLMVACAGSALVVVRWSPMMQGVIVLGWVLIYTVLAMAVCRSESTHTETV